MRASYLGIILIFVMSLVVGSFQTDASLPRPSTIFPPEQPEHYQMSSNSSDDTKYRSFRYLHRPVTQKISKPRYRYPGEALKFINRHYPTLVEAVFEIGKNYSLSRWAANFGAKDGKTMGDEVYGLFHEHHFAGIAVEAASRWEKDLKMNLPAKNISKVFDFVSPQNCEHLLVEAGVPRSPDALKMDIDSFDGPVLLACVKRIRPKIIFAEINPWVPPPFGYAMQWTNVPGALPGSTVGDASMKDKGIGVSLAWLDAKLSPRGYNLIGLRGYHEPDTYGCDAIWVAEEYDVFGDIPHDALQVWQNWDAVAGDNYLRFHTKSKTGNDIFIDDSRRWLERWLQSDGFAEADIFMDIWNTLTTHNKNLGVPFRGFTLDVY